MTGTTTTEGYPYPLTSDFSDVQDAYRLATSIDSDLRSEQAPFRAILARPSFIARQVSTQSAFIIGDQAMQFQAIDWDNTGGAVLNGGWSQPFTQGPSWWKFGCTILVANSAAGVVGELVMGRIQTTSVDPVTGVQTVSNFYQRNDESNTAGEWLNLSCMVPLYQGTAAAVLTVSGTVNKAIAAGSRFWGMYLGPVT